MKKKIIHQINIVGIGGVQTSFGPYIEYAQKSSNFSHEVFSNYEMDSVYRQFSLKTYYIKNVFSFVKFLSRIISSKCIIHFYNNLGSKRIKLLLSIVPSSNIIFHERGASWNTSTLNKKTVQKNADKAKLILANSYASKELLIQKFDINPSKIKVVYNGFLGNHITFKTCQSKNKFFTVGYIGRLDTPKGVEILINAAKYLPNLNFKIAGDGPLKNHLISKAKSLNHLEFVGRVANPFEFISGLDVLVVPSVREPLGNVIIEAGFLKKPVIASCVDGIPELINHEISGILLQPKNKVSNPIEGSLNHPEYVINGISKKLDSPKYINALELSNTIEDLSINQKKRAYLANNLNKHVMRKHTLANYFDELEKVYNEVFNL